MKQEIHVCTGRSCRELGSERIYEKIKKKLAPLFGAKKASVQQCKCLGYCEQGANIIIDDKIIHEVTGENVFDRLTDESTHRSFRQGEAKDLEFDDFLGDISLDPLV